MKRTYYAFLAALLLVVATAGSASADATKASQILTKDLAEKISGGSATLQTAGAIKDTEYGKTWASSASYSIKNDAQLNVTIKHSGTAEEAKRGFEQSRTSTKGDTVSGIGDAAFRTKMPAQLNVLSGKNWLIITAGTFRSPDTSLQEKAARELVMRAPD